MNILYILLTVLLFLDCVLLVFLVLLQLPKKEAGVGMAFGGAATDALFGAGSGNVLTKITKYVAGIFFGLALIMSIMASRKPQSASTTLQEKLSQGTTAPTFSAPPIAPANGTTNPAAAPQTGPFLNLTNVAPAPVHPAASNAPASGTNK